MLVGIKFLNFPGVYSKGKQGSFEKISESCVYPKTFILPKNKKYSNLKSFLKVSMRTFSFHTFRYIFIP